MTLVVRASSEAMEMTREKVAAVTVSVKVVVWTTAPAVPVTVIVETARGVPAVVVIVIVVVQVGEHEVGENEAEAPEGTPDAVNDTAAAVPVDKVAVAVFVTDEPWATDLFPPLLNVKSKAAWVVAFTMDE